ncbi:partner of Y14 and mago-like [Clavelina lepadiformis]|uniref:partner of Y14 and mago-like n=1 Tax=Clavelina lepadiformis TaxID=159417 RepID=UPI0040410D49
MSSSQTTLKVSQATGIVRDDRGVAFIPATQRPDGTWRKAQRVKEGYVPEEDVKRYQSSAAKIRQCAPACPGYTPSATPSKPGQPVPGLGSSPSSKSNDIPISKGAKKNLKRKEQRKKKREEENESIIKKQYDDLISGGKEITELSKRMSDTKLSASSQQSSSDGSEDFVAKRIKTLRKKLRQIEELKSKIDGGMIISPDKTQLEKVSKYEEFLLELSNLESKE